MLVLLCGFFRGFQCFDIFFEQVFHSGCIQQKRECNQSEKRAIRVQKRECRRREIFLAGRKQITSSQSTCIRDDLFAIAHF